jgi:MFS family permease
VYLSDRPRDAAGTPPGPAVPASGRRVGSTVVLLGFVSLLTDISSESLSAVLPLYLTAVLGLSPLAYGFIDGLYQGISALVRILGGWLSDKADRPKWIAFLGYGLSAATKVMLIPAQGLAAVTAVITVDRLGKGLRTAPRDAIIAASTPEASLGRAFGVHRSLDTTGAAIGPLMAFSILWLVPGDYRAVFIASLAAALLGLALLALLVPDMRPRRVARRAAIAPPATPSWRSLAQPRFGRVVVAAAVLGVLTISDGFLYLSLQERDDFAGKWFPLLFVGTNIAYLSLAVPFGRLSDRLGRAKVLVGGHLLLVGAYLCSAQSRGGLAITLLCLLLLGSFYACTDGVLAALSSTLVPSSMRASGIATAQTVVAVARFASSLLFGALWTGLGRATAVYAVSAALVVAVAICWWLLRGVERPAELAAAAA